MEPTREHPSIVGWWWDDPLYSPGAQSSWVLYFGEDHRGMLAYITGLSSEVSAFRWELTGGSVTTISAGYALCGKNDKPLQLNPGGGLALGPTSVSVGPEETPSGVINVLRFPEEPDELAAAGHAFGEQPSGPAALMSLPLWDR